MMNKRNIILIIVAIIILGFAFNYLFRQSSNTSSSLSVVASSAQNVDTKNILVLLQEMNLVKLDNTIFNGQVFKYLKDTSVTLVPQPVGRLNPFAPMNQAEINSVVASSTTR